MVSVWQEQVGDNGVLVGFDYPHQAEAGFASWTPFALHQRFSLFPWTQGTTVLDELCDADDISAQPWIVPRKVAIFV